MTTNPFFCALDRAMDGAAQRMPKVSLSTAQDAYDNQHDVRAESDECECERCEGAGKFIDYDGQPTVCPLCDGHGWLAADGLPAAGWEYGEFIGGES